LAALKCCPFNDVGPVYFIFRDAVDSGQIAVSELEPGSEGYPPDLETLVNGVDVLPITSGGMGRRGNLAFTATEAASEEAAIPKTKVYMRQIPVDPMTGKADWDLRSCYDPADASSWGGENVFDVHSKSEGTALNGDKYRDW